MISPIKAFQQGFSTGKDITVSGGSISPARFGFQVDYGNTSFNNLVDLAIKNPLSRRAIDYIASNIASIPLKVVRVQSDGSEQDQGEHEILELLKSPGGPNNKRYTKEWLFNGKVWAMMGGGEYWLRGISPEGGSNAGVPRKLQLFDKSDFNHFNTDREGFISGYNLSRELPYGSKNVETDTEETLHVFNYNPKRRDRGLPILISVFRALSLMQDADNWNKNIAQNKGQVPGWLMPKGLEPGDQLDPTTREQAQDQVDEVINEGRKGNKWTVLGGAFEPQANNITPKEASYLKSLKYYGRLVSIGLGIDPTLIGDEAAQTYDNFKTAKIISFTTRIIPMMEFFLSSLNRHVTPKFESAGETLRVTFDPMMIDALREAMLQKVETLTQATDTPILTADEARKILGREPVGLDELVLKLNLQTHSMLTTPQSDIESGMSSLDTKSDKELAHEIERIVNGNLEVDKHRNGVT